MTVSLTVDDVMRIARLAIAPTGLAVRDPGLLHAAVARPQAGALGADVYPHLTLKAAAMMESLDRNHALVDGNQRLAWEATVVCCALNGLLVTAPSVDEGERLVLAATTGDLEVAAIAATLLAWSAPMPGADT